MKKEKYQMSLRMGGKLRELRRSYGMTQESLAEKLDVHPSYVGQLERGEREPSLHTLEKLAHVFNISPAEFIEEETKADREALKKECDRLLNRCTLAQLCAVRDLLSAFICKKK
jgi:transcriptional regulator with XRE-family HTH domain